MGVLGGKSSNTVSKRQCSKRQKQDGTKAQVCKFTEEDQETGETKKEAVIEADLDENGQVLDTHENVAVEGENIDDWVEEKKRKTQDIAEENASGGALGGNTEI